MSNETFYNMDSQTHLVLLQYVIFKHYLLIHSLYSRGIYEYRGTADLFRIHLSLSMVDYISTIPPQMHLKTPLSWRDQMLLRASEAVAGTCTKEATHLDGPRTCLQHKRLPRGQLALRQLVPMEGLELEIQQYMVLRSKCTSPRLLSRASGLSWQVPSGLLRGNSGW
jgi:hypothetical protein